MNRQWRTIWRWVTWDRRGYGVAGLIFVAGLLLWSRLIVVTDLPRMAIANDPALRNHGGTDNSISQQNGTDTELREGASPIRVTLWTMPRRDPFVISRSEYEKQNSLNPITQDQTKSASETTEEPVNEIRKKASQEYK